MSLLQLMQTYPDDAAAEQWFVKARWPDGIICPHCGSDNVNTKESHPTMPYRCRRCRRCFSAKTDSVMHASKLGYSTWLVAIYLITTSPKSISSHQLVKHLGVQPKTAWHLSHRIREVYKDGTEPFFGTVEVDETWVGSKARNLPLRVRRQFRMDGIKYEKTAVIGAKERESNKVAVEVIPETDMFNLKGFVHKTVKDGATVYTDQHQGYIHRGRKKTRARAGRRRWR